MDTDKGLRIKINQFAPKSANRSIILEQEHRSIRVMMIGPGSGIIGGISTLVDTILPAINNEVKLYYFPTVSNRPSKRSGKFSLENIGIAFEQFSRFIQAVNRFHPQIIHIHTSQGLAWLKDTLYILYAKFIQIKVIVHLHAAEYEELYTKHNAMVKWYTRWVLSKSDAVIAVSDLWKEHLQEIVPVQKVYSFKNCMDRDFSIAESSPDDGQVNALFLGSIGPRKGAFDLIEAAALFDAASCGLHIWLAGYEERPGDLEIARRRITELHLDHICELTGVIRGEKKRDLLQQMDVFILPSHNEGLPMAILEAMAVGKPVISCPVGGISEIVIDGRNGFLVTPGDARSLSQKMELLARDPELRKRMGGESMRMIEDEFSVSSYVERLVTLYGDLIK